MGKVTIKTIALLFSFSLIGCGAADLRASSIPPDLKQALAAVATAIQTGDAAAIRPFFADKKIRLDLVAFFEIEEHLFCHEPLSPASPAVARQKSARQAKAGHSRVTGLSLTVGDTSSLILGGAGKRRAPPPRQDFFGRL